jgi:hypothetical protein
VGYHYGVPQVSIDEGNTWVLLKNPDDNKIDMLGRIDNIFIAYKKECELFGRGYNITGFCQLYILSKNR